ncbi:unnamed protein product [Malus baccata var. baccata]
MRVEARRQRREHEDKLPAEKLEKEMKNHSTDGRSPGGKKSKMDKERGFDNSRNILETEPSTSRISISNAGRENIIHEKFHEASSSYGYKAEVPSNLDREMENSIGITSQEQSYDISPYTSLQIVNLFLHGQVKTAWLLPFLARIEQTQRRSSPQKAFTASLKSSCPETIN